MKCADCSKNDCNFQGKVCTKERIPVPEYEDELVRKMWTAAAKIEAEHYMKKTRLEEVILFCQEVGIKHIGLAFCVGLSNEAKIISRILENYFKVDSVICKVCGMDKKEFGMPNVVEGRYEATCNPIAQAKILGEAGTELNLIIGLCIGHDAIFTKYSTAPVSTLVVKDRVTCHNPLAPVYSKYYQRKLLPPEK
ncbi:DUF1847 domain-containing protein [Carboxydocella sp. ULO1]|uniref:DUF1847 domain-containing protein n=1 Tax=Carboxydocella sp. ULO1 TaxID=1926599 RepID=UPI0009AEFF4A|nr:DUF1847 domain-containing protein [Carboxydocella sp. ULO1]GAW29942.1 hypothetical protein ULO1_25120 [Carboxydocella sp. ULO1]